MKRSRGFTLVELAIVVIVLAVVAAIVVPRFSAAGVAESRMDDLCNHLQLLRSQIELYKVQHGGLPPMRTADGEIDFDPTFEQMRYCTDTDGNVKSDRPKTKRDDVHIYGPYLDRVPRNPFNGSDSLVRARSRDEVPVAGGAGWAYVPETGEIYANHSAHHAGL
ncbi:prepilin-type N-terminal cleavage/methylation domain-containing protein [Anaerobaca lacustris]|uniref:Prepilin-type N-terminal cleavage/methylation domain-containing protein n=1 Tax=Anaerobaca lacustris TaxID=3044600 RepID=A0AAW6TT37_9BACT|nr:prepilin-type N-terminal cleavage/methylation domain-containing protein [Sedimentisphaerales bacterium M17dextr]